MTDELQLMRVFFPKDLKEEDVFSGTVSYKTGGEKGERADKDRLLVLYSGYLYVFPHGESEDWLVAEPERLSLKEDIKQVDKKWRQVEVTCRHKTIQMIKLMDEGLFSKRQVRRFLSHL